MHNLLWLNYTSDSRIKMKMTWDFQPYQHGAPRLIKHVAFWIIFISSYALAYGSYHDDYLRQFQLQLVYLPEKVLITYLVIYWVLPKYLTQLNKTVYVLWFTALLLFGGFLHWVAYLLLEVPYFTEEAQDFSILVSAKVFKGIFYIYPVVVIAVTVKLFQYFYENQKKNQELAQGKLKAELEFLKAQIHPHFLFNTLNNLYALSLKNSPNAPEMVLKLSALLDYMLYECNAPLVPLQKELALVEDYVDLERLRYGSRLQVNFCAEGDTEHSLIRPLLLLPFVENAFKHGVSGQTDQAWVNMKAKVRGNKFTLIVENSKTHNGVKDQQGYTEGIGIKNVKRRLELQYPSQHRLTITDQAERYKVILEVHLMHEYEVSGS